MTFTVSPWLVWAGLCLALFGLVFVWQMARAAVRDAWEWLRDRPPPPLMILRVWAWLRHDRVTPLLEDELGEMEYYEDELPPLPPERTWEQMTSHQLPVVDTQRPEFWTPENLALLRPERERRPPAYEAEHRAHYVAMGFDYPSGLMARVRELTP